MSDTLQNLRDASLANHSASIPASGLDKTSAIRDALYQAERMGKESAVRDLERMHTQYGEITGSVAGFVARSALLRMKASAMSNKCWYCGDRPPSASSQFSVCDICEEKLP
jgi:hypothetical protein